MFSNIIWKIKEAANAFKLISEGKLASSEIVMNQYKMMQLAESLEKPYNKIKYEHYTGDDYETYNWTHPKAVGMLVIRSELYMQQHTNEKNKIGIITRVSLFMDGKKRITAHPIVFWEGSSYETMNHPLNIIPYKYEDKELIGKVIWDHGQYA